MLYNTHCPIEEIHWIIDVDFFIQSLDGQKL
jgi:hypothetical protein